VTDEDEDEDDVTYTPDTWGPFELVPGSRIRVEYTKLANDEIFSEDLIVQEGGSLLFSHAFSRMKPVKITYPEHFIAVHEARRAVPWPEAPRRRLFRRLAFRARPTPCAPEGSMEYWVEVTWPASPPDRVRSVKR
jgi:hypothetical protein